MFNLRNFDLNNPIYDPVPPKAQTPQRFYIPLTLSTLKESVFYLVTG